VPPKPIDDPMAVSVNLSVQTPDIAAAIQLASVLAQANCDVWIEPQSGQRYQVRGATQIASELVRSLVTAWIDREQICCDELILADARQLLVPMIEVHVPVAA
jgi:hypothetical protein